MQPGPSRTGRLFNSMQRVSPRADSPTPSPVFFAAAGGADPALLARLLDSHAEIDAHPRALLIHPGTGGTEAAQIAMAEMLEETMEQAAMRVRNGHPTRVRYVGAQLEFTEIESADRLAAAFAEAPLICLLADGRQAVVADRLAQLGTGSRLGGQPASPPCALFCGDSLRRATMRWISSLRAPLRAAELLGDRVRLVRAEDLDRDTVRTFARICRWLGVSSEAGRVLAAVESARARSGGAAGVPPWRSVFTESDKAAFKRIAGELLIELGYEADTAW